MDRWQNNRGSWNHYTHSHQRLKAFSSLQILKRICHIFQEKALRLKLTGFKFEYWCWLVRLWNYDYTDKMPEAMSTAKWKYRNECGKLREFCHNFERHSNEILVFRFLHQPGTSVSLENKAFFLKIRENRVTIRVEKRYHFL